MCADASQMHFCYVHDYSFTCLLLGAMFHSKKIIAKRKSFAIYQFFWWRMLYSTISAATVDVSLAVRCVTFSSTFLLCHSMPNIALFMAALSCAQGFIIRRSKYRQCFSIIIVRYFINILWLALTGLGRWSIFSQGCVMSAHHECAATLPPMEHAAVTTFGILKMEAPVHEIEFAEVLVCILILLLKIVGESQYYSLIISALKANTIYASDGPTVRAILPYWSLDKAATSRGEEAAEALSHTSGIELLMMLFNRIYTRRRLSSGRAAFVV